MEKEAREILKAGLSAEEPALPNPGERIRRRFDAPGGVDLPAVPREAMRQPPDFR
jgi:hypothetical protein